jgi:hypothetical protein
LVDVRRRAVRGKVKMQFCMRVRVRPRVHYEKSLATRRRDHDEARI